jgi:DNA-binding MarR family transcriptional regulator
VATSFPATGEYQDVAALRAALRRFERRSEQIPRRYGLTPRLYLLLVMIKGDPEGRERSTASRLADRLQLSRNTVTELIQRAERGGLIERERSQSDARVSYLSLTGEGERRLALSFEQLRPERDLLARIAPLLAHAAEQEDGSAPAIPPADQPAGR